MKEIKTHPLAEIFPTMPVSDIKDLADDIKKRGLQSPITIYEGKILDGRHRYEACTIAGVKPTLISYKGGDPLSYVIAANLKRRHLTTAQKAMVAATIENMPNHRPENKDANLHTSRTEAANSLDVSARSVATASKILDENPSLAKQVRDGKISLNAAEEKIDEQKLVTEKLLDETGCPVPPDLRELWLRRGEIREMMAQVSNIENRLIEFQKQKDPLFVPINFSSAITKLQFAHMEIKAAQLYAVCTTCQGRQFKKCSHCKGRGFLSQSAYKLVPSEIRAMREKRK